MSLDLNALTQYVEEKRLPLIRKAVVGGRTAKEFELQTGVKGKTALNLLDTSATLQDGSNCGWNEAGTTKLSQRYLDPGYFKVNMSFCDKAMLKYWMNYDVRVAAGQKELPFAEDFIDGIVADVQAQLEKLLWQGNTDNGDQMSGMIKIAEDASVPTHEYATGATISSIVAGVYAKLPTAVFEKGDVVLYMGTDAYRKYIQELIANGNLVITNVVNDVAMPDTVLIPGTNVRVIPVAGLDNTGKMFASYRENFYFGTDLADDAEKFDFWYSQDNREFRLAIEFNAAVQVAYPDMVVEAKEQ